MIRDKQLSIIGAGAMGGALCRGLVESGTVDPARVLVSDANAAATGALRDALHVECAPSNMEAARRADILLLAVKPHLAGVVLNEVSDALMRDGGTPLPLVLSIAAGVTLATLQSRVPSGVPIIRAMPNTPAQIRKGAAAFARGSSATDEHAAQAKAVFESVGLAVEVPEALLDAVTGLSGSGPAYVYLIIEGLAAGGIKMGLPREVAYQLAAQTVMGAAEMVVRSGQHPALLKDMVTTPAGTTIAGLDALEHAGVRAAMMDAVERATLRSKELG